ncbi:hypothetical protein HZU75_04140 [Chitinibacter fontanus]|uniref:Putative tail fiber protein gp53-like C-terminal domain-containing protein n=1 Tax=Chitinibacter fontanus TaxID=1737446 RepID=A0A7D5Z1K0_9NEIS|nr:hypothetical protein [Chitinibacter fontanus]QLI80781.1 hypothetical protein HZU75_04140 [Chitinibacter fontanus]
MDYPKTVPGVGLVAGKFSDGDVAQGVPASLDPAAWANAVTDELLAVIVAGGLVPTEGVNNQLLQAIQAIAPSFSDQTGVLSANGWFQIPIKVSGVKRNLIVNFVQGKSFASSGAVTDVTTLPITFPNVRLATVIGHCNNGAATEAPVVMRSAGTTLSQTTVYCANAVATATGYSYIAIGY